VTFFAWLCSLDKTALGRIIANRPEIALLAGPVKDRADLTMRLQIEPVVAVHYISANQPIHDVVEMTAASGGQMTIEALAKEFDLAADDADLLQAVHWLTSRGLAWPDAQGLHLIPALLRLVPQPHGLGEPARSLLEAQTVPMLTAICAGWGLRPEKGKARLVDTMVSWLSVPANIQRLLATAPADVRAELKRMAWKEPVTTDVRTAAVSWGLNHGLLYNRYWSAVAMPAEVGRGLRGADWRPTFTPHPPALTTVPVAPGLVHRESAAAARILLEQVGALTAECARNPLPTLKTGGVGVRELRRLGKVVGCDEKSVRLCLEVAFEAELLELEGEGVDSDRVLATAEYDAWLAKEPAIQLAQLLTGWLALTTEPYAAAQAKDRPPALVESDDPTGSLVLLRLELLSAADRLPQDEGLVADDGLAPAMAWQVPGLELETSSLVGLWQEARAMGIVAHGALTPLGRALAAADRDQILAAARDLVGTSTTSAIFQADLTVVVPGIPDHALASLLDSAADRESRGGALIWRFSSASVRRAIDAGMTADELTSQLTAASGGGVIPQPLAYLISDIGRQYGRVRVREFGCVIHGVEEALLTEILNAKALRGLGLTRLAPTVLGATSPQTQTLAALRSAGYFPAAEQPDGNPQVSLIAKPRASAASAELLGNPHLESALPGGSAPAIDPYELADQLCARPPGKEPPPSPAPRPGLPFGFDGPGANPFGFLGLDDDDYEDGHPTSPDHELLHLSIEEYADVLDSDGVCALATAIEFSEPVRVTYRPIGSRKKVRGVIEPEAIVGEYVRARDIMAGMPIKLRLGDIERVHPM
jgi:hypothetical protein